MTLQPSQDYKTQIKLTQDLLNTVRHAAYATTNEDGSPHNSPLKLIYNDDLTKLYIGSYSESLHVQNLLRTGQAFAAIYDSFTKGKSGIYITGINAHECVDEELTEALRVHNAVRMRQGSSPLDISYYQLPEPSQRMYSIDIAKIEIYDVIRGEEGLSSSETRVQVEPSVLKEKE